MHVLYLAFACNPFTGSEAQCGWSWVIGMHRFTQVSVVTRTENKKNIEKYLSDHKIADLEVYYCDVPELLNFYYKAHKAYHLYYIMWQYAAYRFVKKLHNKKQFDIIHHVTLGDFRFLGPYWKLDAKVVFGPVGGAQLTPKVFAPYVEREKINEKVRAMINAIMVRISSYRNALNHTDLVLAANEETQRFMQTYMDTPEKCELLTENGVRVEDIMAYTEKEQSRMATLLWAGRMVYRKGLSLLLDVIHLIPKEKQFQLILVGDGPERSVLEKKACALGLHDKVHFVGNIPYKEMQGFYRKADVFVFPSLRETTGTVLFEAMSNGLPIIAFDQNGAKLLVDEFCGYLVRIDCPLPQILEEFAAAIVDIIDQPEKQKQLGRNAYEKITSHYLWERKCELFFERYQSMKEN